MEWNDNFRNSGPFLFNEIMTSTIFHNYSNEYFLLFQSYPKESNTGHSKNHDLKLFRGGKKLAQIVPIVKCFCSLTLGAIGAKETTL